MNDEGIEKYIQDLRIEVPELADMEAMHEQTKYFPQNMYANGARIARYLLEPRAVLETSKNYKNTFFEKKIVLPPPANLQMGLTETLDRRSSNHKFTAKSTTNQEISNLLSVARVNREKQSGVDPSIALKFRRYPSGGALFPIEIYPILLNNSDSDVCVTRYDPANHALSVLKALESKDPLVEALYDYEGYVESISMVIALTAVVPRTTVKYGARGYRFALIEAGLLGFLFSLGATAVGLGSLHWGGFYDDIFNDLLGIDGVSETVVNCLLVGATPDHE